MSWTKPMHTSYCDDNDVSSERTMLLFVISNANINVIEENHIFEFFSDMQVKDVYIPTSNETENNNYGDVFIEFYTKDDFIKALELIDIKKLNGRRLRLKEAEYDPRPKNLGNKTVTSARETSATSTSDTSITSNMADEAKGPPVPLPRTITFNADKTEQEASESKCTFVASETSTEDSQYQEIEDFDEEMEELSLYFEPDFEIIGEEDLASVTCSSTVQPKDDEAVSLKTEEANTTNVKEVENETNTDLEDDIVRSLSAIRKENCNLYKMLMGFEEEMNDGSLQDLVINHKQAHTLVLEQFDANTKYFFHEEYISENFQALLLEIEAIYDIIKVKKCKQQEAKECELSAEMHQVILNVIECYKLKMLEISEEEQSRDIEQRHASALTQALDSFELLAESMEDKQVALNKLFNELESEYEQLKQEEKKIYLDEQRMKLEMYFEVKLRENERNFEVWSILMTEILIKFDELTRGICFDNLAAQREQLEKAMLEECVDIELIIVERERSAAFEQYCNHMEVCCFPANSDDKLTQQHLQYLTIVADTYMLKTKGLPHVLVQSHLKLLKEDICKKLNYYKRQIVEKDILQRHKLEYDQINEATALSCDVYSNTTSDFESENLQTLDLDANEEHHVLAMSRALDTYDMLTEHMPIEVTQLHRKALISSFDVRYNNYKKLRIDMVLTEQMKIAQNAFSERMRCAVRDSDSCPTLQATAKLEILANFDASTQHINSGEVAVYRNKLEESFVFCMDLVQTAWKSAGSVGTCCVCLERRTSVVFQPCLHLVTCDECAAQLTMCAFCQAHVEKKLHVFQQ